MATKRTEDGHKQNTKTSCPVDTFDQDPISLTYTTILQSTVCLILLDCFTSCI